MTRTEAAKICAEIRKWDTRPFITPEALQRDMGAGKAWVTRVWLSGGPRYDLDAYTHLGHVRAAMRGGADPLLELDTIDGVRVRFHPSQVEEYQSVARVSLACSNCWKRYGPDERGNQGYLCDECYASDECPDCGGLKKPDSWECGSCRKRLFDGFVAEVAGAFGVQARRVDPAQSFGAGEWVDG